MNTKNEHCNRLDTTLKFCSHTLCPSGKKAPSVDLPHPIQTAVCYLFLNTPFGLDASPFQENRQQYGNHEVFVCLPLTEDHQ